MEKFVKIPLLFLFIGALLGLFLRLQFLYPTPGVSYSNFLHAHSHTMFLGWVFNALYLIYVLSYITVNRKFFIYLFIFLQLLTLAMLISFPLQGYGVASIVLSTVHTVAAFVFIVVFYIRTRNVYGLPVTLAKLSMLFFMISALGPFSLGYIMANGYGHTQWYFFSVYYYLHFQYNGFFLFGVMSTIVLMLDRNGAVYDEQSVRKGGKWLAIATVPAYFLSVLWADPGIIYNIIGGVAGLIQIAVLGLLCRVLTRITLSRMSREHRFYLGIAFICFSLKVILQLASAFPAVAQLSTQLRPVVIAYLHLVMLGVVTLAILLWYIDAGVIGLQQGAKALACFIAGFAGMELCLVLQPWWAKVFPGFWISSIFGIAFFSILLCISTYMFLHGNSADKNHFRT